MYWDAENSERRCISVVILKQSLCFLYTLINKRIININLFSWISHRVGTTSQLWLVKMKNSVFLWAFPINVFIFTFSSLSIRCRNLSTKHIGFSWKPNVKRMEEPSSLSWSNRYDLAYGRIHQSLNMATITTQNFERIESLDVEKLLEPEGTAKSNPEKNPDDKRLEKNLKYLQTKKSADISMRSIWRPILHRILKGSWRLKGLRVSMWKSYSSQAMRRTIWKKIWRIEGWKKNEIFAEE